MSEPKRGRPRKGEPPRQRPRSEAAGLFGRRLRAAREAANMTREALASAAGVSDDTVERYEAGEYEPKLVPAMQLAAALGVSLDSLAGGLLEAGK